MPPQTPPDDARALPSGLLVVTDGEQLPVMSGVRSDDGSLLMFLPGAAAGAAVSPGHPMFDMAMRAAETGGRFLLVPPDAKEGDTVGGIVVQVVDMQRMGPGFLVVMAGTDRVTVTVSDSENGLVGTYEPAPEVSSPELGQRVAAIRAGLDESPLADEFKQQLRGVDGDPQFVEAFSMAALAGSTDDAAKIAVIASPDPSERLRVASDALEASREVRDKARAARRVPVLSGARTDEGGLLVILPGDQVQRELPSSDPLFKAATRALQGDEPHQFILTPPGVKPGDSTGGVLVEVLGGRWGPTGGIFALGGKERVEATIESSPEGPVAAYRTRPDVETGDLTGPIEAARRLVEQSVLPDTTKAQLNAAGDGVEFINAFTAAVLEGNTNDQAVATLLTSDDPAERLATALAAFPDFTARIAQEHPELELAAKFKNLDLPADVRRRVDREITRYKKMDPRDPSRGDIEPWLKLVSDLPWGEHPTPVDIPLRDIRASMDERHAGMDEAKNTLIQQVDQYRRSHGALNPNGESAKERAKTYGILLVGPPGTGKTTLVESFAKAINKGVIKANVGGVYSGGELNGSDRVFRGSHAGQIIQQLADKGVDNVLLLDEIDKITSGGMNGDPYAVLLEILDPSRNEQFQDRWLELPFDISEIPVIVTANDLSLIPDRVREALLDRLDIVQIDGYTIPEKIDIAHSHILPRAYSRSVSSPDRVQLTDDAIEHIVRDHTSAAGMRQLERKLSQVLNAEETRMSIAEEDGNPVTSFPVTVDAKRVDEILGAGNTKNDFPVEWDEPGRGIWMYVAGGTGGVGAGNIDEYPANPDKRGQLVLTGSVADGIKESAQAAYGWVVSHREQLGIDDAMLNHDLQINYGDIGMPKDGPSAGTMTTLLIASQLMRVPVRSKFTMTGTIEPGGRVGKIGGTVAKIIGAYEAGVRTVLIPEANEGDLRKLPEKVRDDMEIIPVRTVEEAVAQAFPGRFKLEGRKLVRTEPETSRPEVIDGGLAETGVRARATDTRSWPGGSPAFDPMGRS